MRTTINSIGKYELKAVLARTPMSTVYDGWDSDIARRVAIKLMRLSAQNDDEAQEAFVRFKRGAQAAGQLNHPNIVAVYDYGETEDYAYLVMEFVDGSSLKGMFDENQRFALADICRITGSILDALQYSHDRGVVHRDVKPANIMFTRDGQVKITDFGIARLEDSEMTQAGMVIGTPAYMSPEQFLGERIDWRTDIYSTGVVLYHILTGERPYEGNLATIMHKVLYGTPLLPSRVSTLVTPAMDAIVTRAMARNREDRFSSASEFKAVLQAARTTTPARPERLAAPTAGPGAPASPARPAASKSFVPILAFLVLAAGAAAGSWYAFLKPASPPPTAINTVVATQEPTRQQQDQLRQRQEQTRREQEQELSRVQQELTARQQEQLQEQLRRQEADAQAHRQQEAQARQQLDHAQAQRQLEEDQRQASLQQQEQARQKAAQDQTRQKQAADQVRQRQAQEQVRLKQLQDATRQKPDPGQLRPKQEQDALRIKPEPEKPTSNVLPDIAPHLSSSGSAGLVGTSLTADTAGQYGLNAPVGIAVTGVTIGGAADRAGVRERDVILKINGAEAHDLSAISSEAASTVPLDVVRQGVHRTVQLQVSR